MNVLKISLLAILAIIGTSCTYDNRTYSSKGYAVPISVQPVVRTVYRPVYFEPEVEIRPVIYRGCYARTILPYGIYCH